MKEYKIIFSDIDGTRLNNENQVPEETIEELRRLDSQGVPFVLVSARMPKGMRPIREELGIHAPMVCYSGGLVLDPDDQEIYSCLLDLDLACEIKSLVAKEFPEVVCGIYGGEHWVVDDIRDPWVIQEQGITHLIPETGDIREIFGKEGGIHKFLFMGDEEAVIRTENRLTERYPQLSIARSKPVYLEVMNGNVCKSAGVKIVCEKYDIPVEQSLAFGDGQNDLDMLNAAGAGFAMANAPEEVKAAFDDAIAARENEQQYIREAEAYTNEVQPRANGQAQRILEEARAYKAQTILEAQGEVARFAKLLPEYKAAPEITRERLYIETMEKVLGNTRKVLVNDKGGNLMVLPLDQMLKGGNAPAAKSDNGASNLLRLPPASSSTTSGASNTSSTSQGDIMDQRRANAQRNDYQRQGE